MAQLSEARAAALAVLGDVRRRKAHARDVLRTSKRLKGMEVRERSLAVRLVMGVTGAIGFLDGCINAHLKRGSRLEPKVRDALRLSAYELLFLHTPGSAAVSQGVELVRSVAPRASGLANAVLRRIAEADVPARERSRVRVIQGDDASLDDLAAVSGYPVWLIQEVEEARGWDAARSLCLSATEPAPVYVAANNFLHTDEETFGFLDDAGLEPERLEMRGSYLLHAPARLASTGYVEGCDVVVADLSAQHVAELVASYAETPTLEVGQGRGTKSILLGNDARRRGKSLRIVGIDSEDFKVDVAHRRMQTAGLSAAVKCLAYDACGLGDEDVPRDLQGPFHTVFVDAPCSGTGTLRRHPEIVWSLGKDSVASLAALQGRILQAASSRVASGGFLCYATCSVLRQENEDVVNAFLASGAGSHFELAGDPFQSIPYLGGPDGHFCAILRSVKRG